MTDYSVIITIVVFVLIDSSFGLSTPKLEVPTVFQPTRSDARGWVIPLINDSCPWYLYIVTAIPAILQVATLPFCPESPKYLLLDQEDEMAAQTGRFRVD